MTSSLRLRDLLAVRPFPAVISGADVAALRKNPNSDATLDFVSGFLGFDARSQHALQTTIASLSLTRTGGAFWLNGVFGSGKSHLLGVLALLSEGAGLGAFAAAHPELSLLIEKFAPRLVVHLSLDEFDAARLGLEEIFWRGLQSEWARRGFGEYPVPTDGARVEAFAALQEQLEARGLAGLCLFFDELSLFLGGRDHQKLQGDAAWLQFLGGHSRRAPLWVFAALQKTIDDISGLERYSLSQIRDRFELLPLALAHLPALVQLRLVQVKDVSAVESLCQKGFETQARLLPRLDFGPQEWRATWPFHPATLELLAAVTGRFFSRTRSAALFCTHALSESLRENRAADFRVAPDSLWDYFAPELEAHPDLRPLETVWRAWNSDWNAIFSAHDLENGRRAAQWVLLCKIAGWSATPIQLANALGFDLGLPGGSPDGETGDGGYEYARFLLERLRLRGAFLAIERGESTLFDRYTVDLGKRVGESARRHLSATLETLPLGDARLVAHALSCCRGEPLPLSELSAPRSFFTFWQSAPRGLSVEVWDGASPQNLANRAAQTRVLGVPDDAVLAIWPPFGSDETPFEAALSGLDETARASLWLWKPRPPARDEWELAREGAAAQIAMRDPVLGDNRRGRAVIEHLQKEAPARDAQLARVALRLLLEGEIVLGGGAILEGSELLRGESFGAYLEAIGDFGWPHLLPKFTSIAPRARILTPSNADSLCLEILRRPSDAPFFAPSLERLARHIAEPLGVAKSSAGRWKIGPPRADLGAEMRAFAAEGTSYAALEAHFAKTPWGLRSEQTAVLTCALLREGDLAAFDVQNAQLEPQRLGLPLRRAVHYLRPGRLPTPAQWMQIAVLRRELGALEANFAASKTASIEGATPDAFFVEPLGAASFSEAQRAATEFGQWRENLSQRADLARARSAQLRRALDHSPESWADFEADSAAVSALLESLASRGAAIDTLESAVALDFAPLRAPLSRFERTAHALEGAAPLLSLHALLTHPDLLAPTELTPRRAALLERLGAGEKALFDAELLTQGADFRAQYGAAYAAWHGAQNEAARWNSWRALSQSEAARALQRLRVLPNRAFGAEVLARIESELSKRCPRDGALSGGEASCSSCGLRLGARLQIGDVQATQAALDAEIAAFARALQEPANRRFLEGHSSPLIEWDGDAGTLLPLLSGAALRDLGEALAPRRRVQRSGAALLQLLGSGASLRELEAIFKRWLDGGEAINGEDEVEIGG